MNEDLVAGIRDSLPFHLGVVPFGMVAGIAAIEAGLTPTQAVGISVIVFAGASQLAALELLGETAPLIVVIGTALIINIRMIMYSASIAPYFADYSRRVRASIPYLLVDQVYAMSIAEFSSNESRDRVRYYLGLGLALWVAWVVGTVAGIVIGTGVPPELELSFAVPLIFLALLVPTMRDRPSTTAAVVGGVGALLAAGVPLNLGLPIGAISGIAAGLAVDTWGER